MRKTLLTIAMLVVAIGIADAQENKSAKTYTKEGKTFVQSATAPSKSDTPTTYVWRDTKGNEYPIILHTYTKGEKAGRTTAYVIRKSAKSGQDYKYYLPNGEEIAKDILNENE